MAADVRAIADILVTEFQNRINAVPIPDTVVSRTYDTTHDLGTVSGRKIDIYPLSYNNEEDVDRESSLYNFRYSFVILERYKPMGIVPIAWIDAQVDFVESYIFNPLDNRDPFFIEYDGDKYWCIEVQVTSVFDYDLLRQQKVFWSEVECVFTKIDKGLG